MRAAVLIVVIFLLMAWFATATNEGRISRKVAYQVDKTDKDNIRWYYNAK